MPVTRPFTDSNFRTAISGIGGVAGTPPRTCPSKLPPAVRDSEAACGSSMRTSVLQIGTLGIAVPNGGGADEQIRGQAVESSLCASISCQTKLVRNSRIVANAGQEVLGPNPNRIALVVFGDIASAQFYLSPYETSGSPTEAMFSWPGSQSLEIKAADYGSIVGGRWFAATDWFPSAFMAFNEVVALPGG